MPPADTIPAVVCPECYALMTMSADGNTIVCGRDVNCIPRGVVPVPQLQYWGILVAIAFVLLVIGVANGLRQE